ncbi:hypothetical protein ACFQVC_09410 [Streptomyces monticola]|uniref:Uncharacterized protein n=1 Tax=Streptomyces monticola TaxID=2666263 RepID=A0ABW2JG83_9ACTN
MRRILVALGLVVGTYLIVRAIAEPFVIDMGDPSTYRDDWGGPSLVGVLAVHCGPGLVAAWLMGRAAARRLAARRPAPSPDETVRRERQK